VIKHGMLERETSRCDFCSAPAVVLIGGRAYCAQHQSQVKEADFPRRLGKPSLKASAPNLADRHGKPAE